VTEGHGGLAGARLRALRLDAGLTQRELAGMARVSTGFVRDLEQGRFRRPSLERVRQLADVLDIGTAHRQAPPRDSGQVTAGRNGWAAGPDPFPGGATVPRIGILGPLVVFHEGKAGSGLSGAPAALLGLLALSANRTVSRPAIVDALWGEEAAVTG
jgi:DNA-binding XRE family transcriptional regulator